MEHLIAFLQPAQDGNRVLDGRFGDQNRLEPALQRGVLFNVLAVFIERRRTDTMQLPARQHRFEQVARIHRAFRFARADNRMQLVDKQDNPAVALFNFLQNSLEAFLKLTAELGSCDQSAHIERKNGSVLEVFRHIAAYNPLCQPFGDGRLADAWFADQNRVVLRLARQNPDDVSDLAVASNDRVELLRARLFDQVGTILFQRVICVLRRVGGDARIAAHAHQRR